MRIHTDTLSFTDFRAAMVRANVRPLVFEARKSKSHDMAYEVRLSGSSPYRPMGGQFPDEFAASWDEWGIFLNFLFDLDEGIVVGTKSFGYRDRADFDRKTDERFRTLAHADQHRRHKWRANGDSSQSCECGARLVWR